MSNSNWMGDFLNNDKKLEVEAFSELPKHYVVVDRQGAIAIAKRANGGEKVAYASRIDKSIMERLEKDCIGTKNSLINALLEYALNRLDEEQKTLLAE